MAIQAAAVEILVEKGRFDPAIAVAIAEAMDMTIAGSQIVTVPILDWRLAELRGELKADLANLRAELVRWVFLVMLGNVALTASVTAFLNYVQRM